jgi:hypothetical protein
MRPLKIRCRILPAGGLGVSPKLLKSPKIGVYRRLIDSISAFSYGELEIGSPLEWITALSSLIPNSF